MSATIELKISLNNYWYLQFWIIALLNYSAELMWNLIESMHAWNSLLSILIHLICAFTSIKACINWIKEIYNSTCPLYNYCSIIDWMSASIELMHALSGVTGLVLELQDFKVDLFALKLLLIFWDWIFICLAMWIYMYHKQWKLFITQIRHISMSPNNILVYIKTNDTCKPDTYSDLFALDIRKKNHIKEIW